MKNLLIVLLLVNITKVSAQVGIGTSTPDASAALEITSTNQGFLPPRMTAAQRDAISNPAEGLVVYCTDCGLDGELLVYSGNHFKRMDGTLATTKNTYTTLGYLYGESPEDDFGTSTAISADGTIIAIGAPNNDGNGDNSGHVRVFEFSSGSWDQLGSDLDGEAGGDLFGTSIALSANGKILAVGAPKNDDGGADAGHVRVFEYTSGVWAQRGSDINGSNAGDQFGYAVEINNDGTKLIVGAPYKDINSTNDGSILVYQWSNSGQNWTQLGSEIATGYNNSCLGMDVDMSADGSTIIFTGNQGIQSYSFSNNTWTKKGSTLSTTTYTSGIRAVISFDGDRIAYSEKSNGLVRVFDFNSDWSQLGSDVTGSSSDQFGGDISMSRSDTIAIVSPYADLIVHNQGAIDLYYWNSTNWIQLGNRKWGCCWREMSGHGAITGQSALSKNGEILLFGMPSSMEAGYGNGKVSIITDLQL